MKIILASTSLIRKNLLDTTGIPFHVEPSDFEEDMSLPLSPQDLTLYLSQGKARAVAQKHADAIVIGADTIVVFGNQILGKPHTSKKAYEMLSMLSKDIHTVLTGLTIIDTRTQKEITRNIETKVWFRKLSEEQIKAYIETGDPHNKSGAYGYLTVKDSFVEKIEGSDTNIDGLPLEDVMEILKELKAI